MVSKASDDLPGAGQAGDHHQPVTREVDVDVLQVVHARAAHRDPVVTHWLMAGFVCRVWKPVNCTTRARAVRSDPAAVGRPGGRAPGSADSGAGLGRPAPTDESSAGGTPCRSMRATRPPAAANARHRPEPATTSSASAVLGQPIDAGPPGQGLHDVEPARRVDGEPLRPAQAPSQRPTVPSGEMR